MIGAPTQAALRWNVIALALAGPALLGIIIWINHLMSPAKWCGIAIGAAKEAQRVAPDCTPILLTLIKVHRDTVWILGMTLSLVIVAIGLAATGMTFRGKALGGEAEFGRGGDDPATAGAERVAGAAVEEAAAVAEETKP